MKDARTTSLVLSEVEGRWMRMQPVPKHPRAIYRAVGFGWSGPE